MSAAVTLALLFFLSVALNEQVTEGCRCIQRHPQQLFCASDVGMSNTYSNLQVACFIKMFRFSCISVL